jgi:hypothetical protein
MERKPIEFDPSLPGNVGNLNHLITGELLRALKIAPKSRLAELIRVVIWPATHRMARIGLRFDQKVAEVGLLNAARWILPNFISKLDVSGRQELPETGPLLIASNHPGVADAFALTANVPRPDLKIVASAMPLFRNLPHTCQHLIFATTNTHERMGTLRSAIRHLRDGGALLIFPSGTVEPDPAFIPGAIAALSKWSSSIGILAKSVPETNVVTAIVSGVLSPRSIRNPLTRLRKETMDRQKLAEVLQVVRQLVVPIKLSVDTHVAFGNPVEAGEAALRDARSYANQIIDSARKLLSEQLLAMGKLREGLL